jgi:molybdenum cofactor biosynthesis enzyme MoaA
MSWHALLRRNRGREEAGFAPVDQCRDAAGVNDDEIVDLARLVVNATSKFVIEYMPLDASGHWVNEQVVTQDEIVAAIDEVFPLEQMHSRSAAPADRWRGTSTAAAPSVSSRRCRSRSVAIAIGCASRQTVSSAHACSPLPSSICES